MRLSPTVPSDYPSLYAMAFGDELGSRWLGELAATSLDRFEKALSTCNTRLTVRAKGFGVAVGMVGLYAVDLADGHARAGLLTAPVPEVTALALQGAVIFFEYAFAVLQLRKIYLEIPEGDVRIPWDILRQFASEEGRLVDHLYDRGRYRDQLILALYRDHWEKAATPLLDSIQDLSG